MQVANKQTIHRFHRKRFYLYSLSCCRLFMFYNSSTSYSIHKGIQLITYQKCHTRLDRYSMYGNYVNNIADYHNNIPMRYRMRMIFTWTEKCVSLLRALKETDIKWANIRQMNDNNDQLFVCCCCFFSLFQRHNTSEMQLNIDIYLMCIQVHGLIETLEKNGNESFELVLDFATVLSDLRLSDWRRFMTFCI